MLQFYTPREWYSLFNCPSLIVDDNGRIWSADEFYKILFGEPSGRIDYAGGKIYGKDLGYGLMAEPIAYLETKNGTIEVRDAKKGLFSAPILYIRDDKVYTPERFFSLFDNPNGFVKREDKEDPDTGSDSASDANSGGFHTGSGDSSGGAPSGVIGPALLKIGGGMLLLYCVVIGLGAAMPLWLLVLLWAAAAVGLGYMGFFAPKSYRTKAFRAGFFALLISSAILAGIILNGLARMG